MKTLFLNILLGVSYFLAGQLSLDLSFLNNIITVGIFIPEGISLAFALYFGRKIIPGIFLGQFFLAYLNGIELFPTFFIAIINSLEALLGIYLFERFKLNRELKVLRDILGFALVVGLFLQLFSALLSNLVLLGSSHISIDTFITSIFSWWFGNVMGQLLVTPFLLILFANYKTLNFKEYLLNIILYSAYFYTIEIILAVDNPFLLFSLSIPISIAVVAKKDMLYGTLFSMVAALVTSYSVYIGVGAFHLSSIIDNTINYNLFIFSQISIILIFGVLFDEKRRSEEVLKETIEKEVNKNKQQQLLMLQQNRLAQMGEMISMIAHQWRQPLNNLSLINQLLISKYNKGKLDIDNVTYFKVNSKKQIDIMSKTIDDFRNFFKAEKEKEKFCVNEMILNTIDMIQAIYTSSSIKIEFNSKEILSTVGYQNALSQAILNIINNAKDALEDTEVQEKKIEITLIQKDELVIINIKDNAGGISENIMDKIFDPYFSTKHDKNGTGLGLYMSKMIINEQGNATVSVKNDTDGANFEITLKGSIDVNS